MQFKRLRSIFLPLVVSLPLTALAGPFTSMFVFGDSLSDTGNLAVLGGGVLPPQPPSFGFNGPYYQNAQLSNGPVWIEGLAAGLGLSSNNAAPALMGGNNYAFAGARTDTALTPPGVLAQAVGLWGTGYAPWGLTGHAAADPNALYVVVGGGNDMRDARSVVGGDAASRQAAAAAAIFNLQQTIGFLYSHGARNVLVSTLPDLGYTPEAIHENLVAESTDATNRFNALIGPGLMGLGAVFQGLHMTLLDMAGVTDNIVANPSAFGITNIDQPCLGFGYPGQEGTVNCGQSAFADVLHPSALVHSLIARAALDVLGVPEPDMLALFGIAVLALVVARRRRMV